MNLLIFFFLMLLIAYGLWRIFTAILYNDRFSTGHRSMQQIGRWYRKKQDFWETPIIKKAQRILSRFVYLDSTAKDSLTHQLRRAGLDLSAEEFTSRKYMILLASGLGLLLCTLLQFWLGVILCMLIAIYGVMRLRESLTARIQKRDDAISMEMPRFVRTLCRTLHNNRDIYSALVSYKKVAGPILGEELDILLSHMRTGSAVIALQQFQKRIGTEAAFRLCSTLQEIDRGIDQTATLNYLADDMARQSKLNIQKELSTRPGKMRATYLPAVGVCIAMIMYVLVVFVMNQLNNLY